MPLIANKIDHYVQLAPTSPCPSDNVRDKLQHAHIQEYVFYKMLLHLMLSIA